MEILKAIFEDLAEILDLQKLAYLSEAQIHNNYSIQPLLQTLDELEKEFEKSVILKIVDDENKKIVGSVRAYEENDRVFIGKLIVHPDYQNKGYGTKLLNAIEAAFQDKTFELFTSSKSEKNLWIYRKNGYKEFKKLTTPDGIELVFLEK
ncbi:MAG: GNAT family N-acetyltransferase [Chitinispirillales bacterium]|jgi:ribosomal protein S18 acetylase RimI-like enzyme|nr:GNAT family N-acetyltransferase [Chitinispirillales bacterium]